MAAQNGTLSQGVDNQNSTSTGYLRDVNAQIGALELPSNFLNNFGAATSSAMSGAVTVGDRILGGSKQQFGVVKILVLIAGAALLIKVYKGFK